MIVTLKEAEGLGCPFRAPASTRAWMANCIHRRCMAWRWEDPAMDGRRFPDAFVSDDAPRGYCGLAGTPVLVLQRGV